jgi:hypothetical protein
MLNDFKSSALIAGLVLWVIGYIFQKYGGTGIPAPTLFVVLCGFPKGRHGLVPWPTVLQLLGLFFPFQQVIAELIFYQQTISKNLFIIVTYLGFLLLIGRILRKQQ